MTHFPARGNPASGQGLLKRSRCAAPKASCDDAMSRPLRLLHRRWEQLQIDVRCALHASEPQRIRHYLIGGAKLARLGVFDEVGVMLHMLQTLLQSARDAELPSFWRSACLECVGQPLGCLRGTLGRREPCLMLAVEDAVRMCRLPLPLPAVMQHHGS